MENEKINRKLAQFQAALRNDAMIQMMIENDGEWILKIIDNVNSQVVATDYLESRHPEWIGNTALHFAVDENILETFNSLLNHGADFTIKNNNNLTVLHKIVENFIADTSEELDSDTCKEYKLDNPFINSVLSAHFKYRNFNNPSNDHGLTHFHVACAANNVEAVKGFLKNGVSINHAVKMDSPTFPGFTSLHFAAKYCAFEVADLLLKDGADIKIKDAKGMKPVHIALERKLEIISDIDVSEVLKDSNNRILRLLLNKESSSDVVIIDEWNLSNFHVSCALNDTKLVEHILQKVVDIDDTVNMDSALWPGYSALHFAALCNLDIVKLLIEKNADINLKNANGVTPFDMCMKRCNGIEDVFKIISLKPAWNNIILSDNKTELSNLVSAMRDANQLKIIYNKLNRGLRIRNDSPLWPGYSPVHLAVIIAKKDTKASGDSDLINIQLLRYLSRQNAKILYGQDIHGYTPLHLAFRLNKQTLVNKLLDCFDAYFKLDNRVDEDGLSFVHIASAKNDARTLERLLAMQANVNAVYRGKSQSSPMITSGSTPLHIAVANGNKGAVDMLMRFGADVYAKDANGMTPIHVLLSSEASTKIASSLLSSMPYLKDSVVDGIGLSHLHVVCRYSSSESLNAIIKLINNGADINARITCQRNANVDSNILTLLKKYEGYSPSTMAYDEDELVNLKVLYERGADIFVKYKNNMALVYDLFGDYELFTNDCLKSMMRENNALISRLKAETGMTSLHIACFELNKNTIKKLLKEGANVNAQILSDSPIQRGYTPLHVIMIFADKFNEDSHSKDSIEVVELLLKAGADVTLQNAKFETVIHLAFKTFYNSKDKESYLCLNMLLEAQQDFSINPVNVSGISHLHIACYVCNVSIAEKFLDYNEINVNQRIDYFSVEGAGCSALQLAAGSSEKFCTILKQLETVELLLTHEADIHTEDFYGETPLHDCARSNSVDLFEKLARSGADVNARNIIGDTPLSYYLTSKKATIEGLKTLIRFGCRLNTYSTLTHKGYLGETIDEFSYADVKNLISTLIMNFKSEMQRDNSGRTAIHNIVSIESGNRISTKEYTELIELLSRRDCDIDDQDNLGKTALHVAVKFYNYKAVSGLLLAGADVNIVDNNGQTALSCDFNACRHCDNNDDENGTKCKHFWLFKDLSTHVKKLQLCGIEVRKQNEDFAVKAIRKLQREVFLTNYFFEELKKVKCTKIEPHALTLYDFLSDYGAVVDYPRMSEIKRNDVNKFFRALNFGKQFPELAEILQLQCRKVKARLQLVELAKNALTDLAGFRLPEICSDFILILLKNSELKSLIASISFAKNKI